MKISTLMSNFTLQINITQDREIEGCILTTRIERQKVGKVKNYNIWIVKLILITQLAPEMLAVAKMIERDTIITHQSIKTMSIKVIDMSNHK